MKCRREAFAITLTGESKRPKIGYSTPAATGMLAVL
jgi:hypothetical protein